MTAETSLAQRVLAGGRAIARAISLIDDEDARAAARSQTCSHTGRAYLIESRGLRGQEENALVDRLTAAIRRSGRSVGILAVDPTSPPSPGAVLGDHDEKLTRLMPACFIRNMARVVPRHYPFRIRRGTRRARRRGKDIHHHPTGRGRHHPHGRRVNRDARAGTETMRRR